MIYQVKAKCNETGKVEKTYLYADLSKNYPSLIMKKLEPEKTYDISVRECYEFDNNVCYGEWSNTEKIVMQYAENIATVNSDMAIQADVNLYGSGSGYHAKIVIGSPVSAVSFGIQHDIGAIEPYAGKTVALLENIASNNKGCQNYPRFGYLEDEENYTLLLALNHNGTGSAYVNGFKVGEFTNTNVVNTGDIHFWVEGAARLNSDYVNAGFQNIYYRLERNGDIYNDVYDSNNINIDHGMRDNRIHCTLCMEEAFIDKGILPTIRISGRLNGIVSDWDYDYESASSVWMFARFLKK